MIGTGRHVVRESLICSCFMFYWRRTYLQYQLIIIILLWKIKITIEINIRLNVQSYIRNTKHWVVFWWTFLRNTDVKIKHKICYLMLASFFLIYLLLISFYMRDKDMFIIHKQLKFFKTFQESYFWSYSLKNVKQHMTRVNWDKTNMLLIPNINSCQDAVTHSCSCPDWSCGTYSSPSGQMPVVSSYLVQ